MVMVIKAFVNQADYENMVRTFWLKDNIYADLEVDGVLFKKCKIAYRGTPSLNYPKKSFKVAFRQKELYQGHIKRMDLSASYPDKSLLRERLTFSLFAKTSVTTPKAWHVDFSIVSKAGDILEKGLYTGSEYVNKHFFQNRNREIGTLYRADGGIVNGVFLGAVLDSQSEAVLRILYAKKNTKRIVATGFWASTAQRIFGWLPIEIADNDEEDYADLDHFIRELNRWDGNSISHHLDAVLDVGSFLDWLAINTLVQANGNYHKNYFLHNRVEDDKWEIIPWNYDLSWGRNWNDYCGGLCDDLSAETSIKGPAQMMNYLSRKVLNNPTCYEQLRSKLVALLGAEFSEEKLFAEIDAYTAEIRELAYQDQRKWPSNSQFDQEQERLKDWIRQRRRFLFKELGLTVASQKLPDTTIIGLTYNPANPSAGDTITFEAVVQNIGSASSGNVVGVAFLVNGQYITFGTSGTLFAGASQSIKSVSTWSAVAGNHTLTAIVDDVNRYPELSETNNMLEVRLQVSEIALPSLSDVTIQDIAFERNEAGQVRLAALVHNGGGKITPDVVGVAFFVDDQFVTYGVIDPLMPGETKPVRAVQPLSLTGQRKVTAIVDDVNRFPEQNEQNNKRIEIIDFGTPLPKLADTVVVNVNLGQSGRFSEGELITFEAQVKNIGTAVTGDVVGVAFLVDGQYITFGNTNPLAAGEARAVRSVSTWQATAGHHRLLAVVDDVNRYPELLESNNRFEMVFEVFKREELQLPDSTLDTIDFETDASGDVVLTAAVSNRGPVATPDVVGVAFFVDGQFATFGTVSPMGAGSTETVRAIQALPLSGNHRVKAIVDDVNRYDELSHQNNTLERDITFSVRQVERRAIWVTRYDWTELGKAPPPEAIDQVVDTIAGAGFNTIFFQVRGGGDAYYTPGLEPWAARLTGSVWATLGQDPGWDPLSRMLEKAHALGIEVHAYLNVYTVWITPPNQNYGQLAPPATQPPHIFDRLTYGPTYAAHPGEFALGSKWRQHDAPDKPMPLQWGESLWASPGVDAVQNHTVALAADVVRRYAVDGIHLDLVRYANRPYSFDPASNAAAGATKTPQRDQWQRERITDLVRRIKNETRSIRPKAKISAAVWPYYQNKWGWRVSSGFHDFYQDSKGWLAAGYADALAPMLYGADADDFAKWQILLEDFLADSQGRDIYPGINGDYEDFNAIAQRIEAARAAGAAGHAIYSYGGLKNRNYWDDLANGLYKTPATLAAQLDAR